MLDFESPQEAFFIRKFGKNSKSLFNTQVELANALISNPETSFHNKNLSTVRSTLSQVFSGERNLNANLRFALFQITDPLFNHKKFNYKEFQKKVIEKFHEQYASEIKQKRKSLGDRDYEVLLEATNTGEHFLITTLEPAELHQSELADTLKDKLIEKTILTTPPANSLPASYKFFLPDTEKGRVAREFWESLREYIIQTFHLSKSDADKRLKEVNSKGIILTFLAPLKIAVHPYVFINYKKIHTAKAFCVSYRLQEVPSVAEMSTRFLYSWLDEYENELKAIEANEEKQFKYEQII